MALGPCLFWIFRLLKTKEYTANKHFHGNGPYGEILTKKEPIRTLGFTLSYNKVGYYVCHTYYNCFAAATPIFGFICCEKLSQLKHDVIKGVLTRIFFHSLFSTRWSSTYRKTHKISSLYCLVIKAATWCACTAYILIHMQREASSYDWKN